MPLYTVSCSGCGKRDAIFRKIAERDERLPECCGPMVRIIEAPAVQGDIEAYESPANPGTWITSRSQRREDLKKAGKIEWEPGIRDHVARKREERLAETNSLISQRVDEVVRDFAVSGRL